MARKRRATAKSVGIGQDDFDAMVDAGFDPSELIPTRGKGGKRAWVPPDDVIRKLEAEGHQPGLSTGAARMNALMARCMNVKPRPLDADSVKFLNDFDAGMRAYARANGIELRDDE